MPDFKIVPLTEADAERVRQFTLDHWGAEFVVAHGRIYYPHRLSGFVAVDADREWLGLLTYHESRDACEIVTLDSLREGIGIGSALIDAVLAIVEEHGYSRLWLITTNDNLNALRFYQKRGFRLVAVHRDAVTEYRRVKPEIPLLGKDGIPLRDELELEMVLMVLKREVKYRQFYKFSRPWFLVSGDPGSIPVTKVGGVPWWPENRERPHCGRCQNPMAFQTQILLSDVPGLEQDTGLLSFHYCEECLPWGWTDAEKQSCYEVTVLEPAGILPDGRGILTESHLKPYTVNLHTIVERLPLCEDTEDGLRSMGELVQQGLVTENPPPDWFSVKPPPNEDENFRTSYAYWPDFTELEFRSKLGGCPSWVQNPEWPVSEAGASMIFVGQIDWMHGAESFWANGGYAYLFIEPTGSEARRGELAILTT